jgi:hypothetical protein
MLVAGGHSLETVGAAHDSEAVNSSLAEDLAVLRVFVDVVEGEETFGRGKPEMVFRLAVDILLESVGAEQQQHSVADRVVHRVAVRQRGIVSPVWTASAPWAMGEVRDPVCRHIAA